MSHQRRLIAILAQLRKPEQRQETARALASELGAEDCIIFVRDQEVDALLPGSGFQQTLPDARFWRSFLADCVTGERHTAEAPSFAQGASTFVTGFAIGDAVVTFSHSHPDLSEIDEDGLELLSLVCALLKAEKAEFLANSRAGTAFRKASELQHLTAALDSTRLALRDALVEAEGARDQIFNIFESITDSIIVLDNDWRFTYVNSKAAQQFQRKPEDLIGKNVWEEYPEAADSRFYHEYMQARVNQQPRHFEDFYPSLDMWIEVHAYPSQEGLSVYFRDITKQKEVEALVRELSTPVLHIADGLLLVPLIGVIDARRASQLADQLLGAIRATRAKVMVVDITGVAFMDTQVASDLIATVRAAKLLGCTTVTSGFSWEVTRRLVRLGIDVAALHPQLDLQQGIETARRWANGANRF